MNTAKPRVVYLHRYPPEIEAYQWPALRAVVAALVPDFEIVYVCMGAPPGQRDPELRRHLRVLEQPYTVDQSRGFDKWFKTLLWYGHMGGLLKRICELDPAVILCQEALPFIPGLVLRLGRPTIIVTADWWLSVLLGDWRWGRRLAAWFEAREVRSWNRSGVRVLACTEAGKRLLVARGLDAERIAVVNAPQNSQHFRPLEPPPARVELGLDDQHRYFAVFGIIRRGKGYEQLLDWWQAVAVRHSDWRLVVIGGAGGETWFRRKIVRRGLHAVVHMTGWLPTKLDVNRWLNAMDAIVVPRRNSPDNQGAIPSALFNGLATGRPVVAAALPSIAEVVRDGVDALLFAPDDEKAFLAALERVVADPAAAAQLGRTGRARAEDCFNPARVVQAYRELIGRMT